MNSGLPIRHVLCLLLLTGGIASAIFAKGLHAQAVGCPGDADSLPTRSVLDDSAICLDCITLSTEVILGEEDGPGYIERAGGSMAIDGLGRYWVLQREGAKVFSPEGDFLRLVGGRGEGPGEFITVTFITADPEGFMHVFDGDNLRVTSFNHDFSVRNTAPTPGPVSSAALLPEGTGYIANMLVATAEGIARSLHTVNLADSRLLASFALAPEGGRLVTPYRLSVDRRGVIYAVNRDRYVINLWSSNGGNSACLERKGLFDPRPSHGLQMRQPGDMPQLYGFVAAIHVDAQGLLWVSAWVLKDDWRENLIKVERPGRPPRYTRGAPGTIYKNIVEVIDVARGKVLARAELGDPFVVGFLSDRIVHGGVYTNEGAPQIAVSNIHFRTPKPRGR